MRNSQARYRCSHFSPLSSQNIPHFILQKHSPFYPPQTPTPLYSIDIIFFITHSHLEPHTPPTYSQYPPQTNNSLSSKDNFHFILHRNSSCFTSMTLSPWSSKDIFRLIPKKHILDVLKYINWRAYTDRCPNVNLNYMILFEFFNMCRSTSILWHFCCGCHV